MGLDRFVNFISKSLNNEGFEELNLDNNIKKIISNYIIFDINFLIYQEIIEIEHEINDIIKIILSLPYNINNNNLLEELLEKIFNQNHWKIYNINNYIYNILDGFNEEIIITNFIYYITNKINNNTSLLEFVIFEKINNTIIKYINNLHETNFIQSIAIFFDGIPSYSKIIEQRKRRIKNYLESIEKRNLFKYYFNNLERNIKQLINELSKSYNITEKSKYDILIFDYLKWINNRFSIDKSINPSSNFIKNIEIYLHIKLKLNFPKINIIINSASENGESDLKIFKYIAENQYNGDYCIHTTDSDLIHQILVQQTYYKILNVEISLSIIKYIKYNNLFNYVQILDANIIIKTILDLYNTINNVKSNNYKIIWDICLIFYLFGNDHLPSSLEIGPELGLLFYLKNHYIALNKSNIVNLKKTLITVDFTKLLLYLEKINETNELNKTKIILQRFFKINLNLVNIFIEKLKLNYLEILDLLKKIIKNKSNKMTLEEINNLEVCDLRYILYHDKNISLEYNLNDEQMKILNEYIDVIEEYIDYYETEYYGLNIYNKQINILQDPYQDLYNYIIDKTAYNILLKYPEYYDHILLNQHLDIIYNNKISYNSEEYLLKLYHLIISQFGNMKNYYSDNLTHYSFLNTPPLKELIFYLKNNFINTNKLDMEINNNIITNYFNSINHYFIITPFLLNYDLSEIILNILKEFKIINNLWITTENINTFNYRKINIKLFLNIWSKIISKVNIKCSNLLLYNNK